MRTWMLSAPACRLFPTASLAFLGLLMACSDTTAPEEEPAIVSKAVIDGAHGGNAGFFFVPPLAQPPGGTGIFDASLVGRLTIEICAIQNGQCGVPAVTMHESRSLVTITASSPKAALIPPADAPLDGALAPILSSRTRS